MKKITIIGSGFAGLTAAKTLRKSDQHCEITIISPKAEFVYMPSLIWLPSGAASKKDIVINLDNFFRRKNINYVASEVVGLEESGRVVMLKNNTRVDNDALIIASGGRFIKKITGIENTITPCEGVAAAEKIGDKLKSMDGGNIAIGFASNPQEPSAMRGGPMFEFLFGIDTQLRREGRRDKFNLTFFTPAQKPGARLGEKAVLGLLAEMKSRQITTNLGDKIKAFAADKVIMQDGEFAADMILFMPGMTGNTWFDNTDLARSDGGLLRADKFCQVINADKIFVAGDSGSFPGPDWLPKQAHMADLQAAAAAKNVLDVLAKKPATHTFKAELMCIIDTNDKGIFVSRTMKNSVILPISSLMHYVKKLFAWWYLRQYK
ncbi:MAG: FAD-dependent oxidoreductase [Candidatus Thioglobus sp.]|nr:FAD-dependent oxidoreductase [Candidatus Thioglobus sp.]